jgi:hypothetical protein
MHSSTADKKSPYLKPNRLGDVLAAIQTMAVYGRYRVSCATWADRISGDKEKARHWRTVFEEHPEFFRRSANADNYSLALRRAHPRRFHRGNREILSDEEYEALKDEEKKDISRAPLQEAQIRILTDIAINLHARAVDAHRDWRWWVAPVLSLFGSFVGAILAFVAAALFK